MPWSYRGLGVESEWRKSDFKKKRRKAGGRRRGADVGEVADASFLSEIFMNALMMNQQWRRKQMAFILNTSLL